MMKFLRSTATESHTLHRQVVWSVMATGTRTPRALLQEHQVCSLVTSPREHTCSPIQPGTATSGTHHTSKLHKDAGEYDPSRDTTTTSKHGHTPADSGVGLGSPTSARDQQSQGPAYWGDLSQGGQGATRDQPEHPAQRDVPTSTSGHHLGGQAVGGGAYAPTTSTGSQENGGARASHTGAAGVDPRLSGGRGVASSSDTTGNTYNQSDLRGDGTSTARNDHHGSGLTGAGTAAGAAGATGLAAREIGHHGHGHGYGQGNAGYDGAVNDRTGGGLTGNNTSGAPGYGADGSGRYDQGTTGYGGGAHDRTGAGLAGNNTSSAPGYGADDLGRHGQSNTGYGGVQQPSHNRHGGAIAGVGAAGAAAYGAHEIGQHGHGQSGHGNTGYDATQTSPTSESRVPGMPHSSMLEPEKGFGGNVDSSYQSGGRSTGNVDPTYHSGARNSSSPVGGGGYAGATSTGSDPGTGTASSGAKHFGPGHEGSKVFHTCENCGKDNDISKYFSKDVVYRLGS